MEYHLIDAIPWLGGVYLTGDKAAWRWDRASARIAIHRFETDERTEKAMAEQQDRQAAWREWKTIADHIMALPDRSAVAIAVGAAQRLMDEHLRLPEEQQDTFVLGWRPVLDLLWKLLSGDSSDADKDLRERMEQYFSGPYSILRTRHRRAPTRMRRPRRSMRPKPTATRVLHLRVPLRNGWWTQLPRTPTVSATIRCQQRRWRGEPGLNLRRSGA
jgi:hypothetical protein